MFILLYISQGYFILVCVCVCVHVCARLVTQLCLTFCDPMDYSPPGSSVHRISQVRLLEWVAISSSRDLAHPGIQPMSPSLADGFCTTEPPGKPTLYIYPDLNEKKIIK